VVIKVLDLFLADVSGLPATFGVTVEVVNAKSRWLRCGASGVRLDDPDDAADLHWWENLLDQAQTFVMEARPGAWPECPGHGQPMWITLDDDGTGYYVCAQGSDHEILVGSLATP
jgi:hypothetical protein